MNLYEAVKATVQPRMAAEHYGMKVNHSGMACCPFHDDRNPSLKLNEDYYYCFGCQAHGDVIDLTAKLLGVSNYEAAKRLVTDFGISTGEGHNAVKCLPKHPMLREYEEIGHDTNENRETVRRFIRLTNLIPELLQKVDDGQIALTPAVELSFLQEHEQRQLLDEMGRTDATPNLSQSQRLRIFSQDGRLSPDVICAIMSEEKANQKERLRIAVDRVKKFFPKSYTTARMEEEIIKLCEAHYRRRMSREAR